MQADVALIKRWRSSPLAFIQDVWHLAPQPLKPGVRDDLPAEQYDPSHFEEFQKGIHLTWQQWLIIRAVEYGIQGKAPRRISVASGHGIGKSATMAILLIWFLFVWLDAQVPTTAPTSDQLKDILWKEIKVWLNRMPEQLSALYEWREQYVRMVERPETWFARARTGRKENPEALAGVHGDHVEALVDEASGVHDVVFETFHGAMTNENILVVMISNPTRLSGYFYDTHHKLSTHWQRLQFDSRESPIVDWNFVQTIIDTYGLDSPQFKVRVAGEFPDAEEDQLISRSLFDTAAARPKVRDPGYVRCLGVDVAYYGGDSSALTERQGFFIENRKTRQGQDTVATANDVMAELKKGRDENNPYDFVQIDIIGFGAGVYDTLKDRQKNGEISKDTRIVGVNVAESAEDEAEFHNKRVELAHRYKKSLEVGCVDAKLREESCAIKYGKPDARGRNTLEPKEETKERLGHSPDLFDSACLTFTVGMLRRKSKEDVLRRQLFDKKKSANLQGWHAKLAGGR